MNIIDGIKDKYHGHKVAQKERREEKERENLQIKLKAMRAENESIHKKKERLGSERSRLLALDEKALQVEMILAVQGAAVRLAELEEDQANLRTMIEQVKNELDDLSDSVSDIDERVDRIEQEHTNYN